MDKGKGGTIKIIISIVILMICYGLVTALANRTFISPWIPVATALAIAAITGITAIGKWRNFTGISYSAVNYIIHLIVATGILAAMFYALNFFLADKSSLHTEKAVVEKRYYETRYKSKRIRRNVYGRGEPYKVYFIDLRFGNGIEKPREISLSAYNRVRKGDTIDVAVERGLFSIPVIK